MANWKEDLYDLCEKVTDELSEANKKLDKTGGKMTAGDADYIDKLTHTLKSIKTTLAMEEYDDEDYSGEYSGARGGRGRGRGARRDSRGRYSNEGRSYEGRSYEGGRSYESMGGRSGRRGYSREDAKEDMMEQLRELETSAQDEHTRRMVREWIKQAERE